jgi:hypothetical protein
MMRLFDTGNKEEARVISDLRAIGCEVHEVDIDGKQFSVFGVEGHLSGHLDGCIFGVPEAPKTWHVLECKTHNAKSFAKLLKIGVRDAKPQHYCQMQLYMHLSGMTRALYLAVNKDTDDLYSERVKYNEAESEMLMDRAHRIINDTAPPNRISTREDYFECSWCPAKSICWNPLLQTASELFGAVPDVIDNGSILDRYPVSDSRIMWSGPASKLKEAWSRLYSEDIELLTPIQSCDEFDCKSAEFTNDRAVFVWNPMKCEIREGIF